MLSLVQLCRTWTVRYGNHEYPYPPSWSCIILAFYPSSCTLRVLGTKRDVRKIDALDQWCLHKLFGIKRYHRVQNNDVRRKTDRATTSFGYCSSTSSLPVRPYCIAWMPDESDAKQILTASPLENWRRPPGRPRTTWMKTAQQDLESLNLSLNKTVDVTQNRPLWGITCTFGATYS